MPYNEMNKDLAELSAAIEKRALAEIERKAAEENRAEIEKERLEIVCANEALLNSIADAVQSLAELMSELEPEMTSQSRRIDIIFEFMRIIVGWLSVQGYREAEHLDALLRDMGRSEMKVEINADRDVSTGDIVEGTKTSMDISFVKSVSDITSALEEDDISGAEQIFNSLPRDAMEVALAALYGPLKAAAVIAEKVGSKFKFIRGANAG